MNSPKFQQLIAALGELTLPQRQSVASATGNVNSALVFADDAGLRLIRCQTVAHSPPPRVSITLDGFANKPDMAMARFGIHGGAPLPAYANQGTR